MTDWSGWWPLIAQGAAEANPNPGASPWLQMIPFVLVLVLYFVIVGGGRRREDKKQQQLLGSL
ncbi:MAG TPA: hypothetical protein VHB77_22455, partial [Planctomycetaceae bacterium]|nr:hypothetical protein [Planctomycetaceae bacterium]